MALVVGSTGQLVVEDPQTLRRVLEDLIRRRDALQADIGMLSEKLTELEYRELDERKKEEECRRRENAGTGASSEPLSAA